MDIEFDKDVKPPITIPEKLALMKPGDSWLLAEGEKIATLRQMVTMIHKFHSTRRYMTRMTDEGLRIWRKK